METELKTYIPQGMKFDRATSSMEEALEREEQLQTELKRMQGKAADLARQLAREQRAVGAREQQILDLGKLLVKHKIDWRKEVVWTDPVPERPPP